VIKASQGLLTIILGLVCLGGLWGAPARANDISEVSGSVTVNGIVDYIAVTPANRTVILASGTTQTIQFTANATFTNAPSAVINGWAGCNWTSSDNSVATIDRHSGLATILAIGRTTISANYTGVTGNATLQIIRSSSGGGGGGGGGGGSTSITSLLECTDSGGKFYYDTVAPSADEVVSILFLKNTVIRSRTGQRVRYISIKEASPLGVIPESRVLVGKMYNISPDGAVFTQSAFLTFKYNDSDLPAGSSETRLVIATWQNGEWKELGGFVIDPLKNKITAPLDHFSYYALMAGTAPASFKVSNVKITPNRVNTGEAVTVSVDVLNAGDLSGSYSVSLIVSTLVAQQKMVTLDGGETQTVSFTVNPAESGEYNVEVNGLSGSLTVSEPGPGGTVAAAPEETASPMSTPRAPASFTVSDLSVNPDAVNASEAVTISAVVTNIGDSDGEYTLSFKVDNKEEDRKTVSLGPGESDVVSFSTARDTPGEHIFDINGQSGQFTIKSSPLLTKPTETTAEKPANTPRTLIIIFGGMFFVVVILFVMYKKLA
jgi:hypothetical protein